MILSKKTLAVVGAALMLVSCGGDSQGGAESSAASTTTAAETTTATTTTTTATTTTAVTTTTTAATTTTTVTTTAPPLPDVSYMGNVQLQYDETNEIYQLIFVLSDQNNKEIAASGTAKIKIVDSKENVLYDKELKFSEDDFTSWTNKVRDDSSYGCWLEIPRDDLEKAGSLTGKFYLTVFGDDYAFDEKVMDISNLPEKELQVNLPNLPVTISDTRYSSHTSYSTVTEITTESKNNYDGSTTLTLNFVITLTKKVNNLNIAETCAIGYTLYDSENFIIDSGTIYTGDMRVGEKTKVDRTILDLDSSESYTLTLDNVT